MVQRRKLSETVEGPSGNGIRSTASQHIARRLGSAAAVFPSLPYKDVQQLEPGSFRLGCSDDWIVFPWRRQDNDRMSDSFGAWRVGRQAFARANYDRVSTVLPGWRGIQLVSMPVAAITPAHTTPVICLEHTNDFHKDNDTLEPRETSFVQRMLLRLGMWFSFPLYRYAAMHRPLVRD